MVKNLNNEDKAIISEYEIIINDFVRIMKEELALVAQSLVIYGSYALLRKTNSKDYFLPDESDLDLVLVIDTGDYTELNTNLFEKVSDSLSNIIFEPFSASIIDLTIIEASVDFPPPFGANFGPLQMKSVRDAGEVIWGSKEIFFNQELLPSMLKHACRTQSNFTWENLKNAFLHRDMYKSPELFWLGVDSILDCAHSYATFLNIEGKPLVRMQVADFLISHELDDRNLLETIIKAHEYRTRSKSIEGYSYNFFKSSLGIVRKINKLIKSEIEQD